MSKTYIGIDSGKSGAIAILQEGYPLRIEPMPLTGHKSKKTSVLDGYALKGLFRGLKVIGDIHVIAEKPMLMARRFKDKNGEEKSVGSNNMASVSFKNAGFILGLLVGLDIPYTEIRPTDWQRLMYAGEPKRDNKKDTSIAVAQRIFPDTTFMFPRGRVINNNMTDAALIAEYGRRRNL